MAEILEFKDPKFKKLDSLVRFRNLAGENLISVIESIQKAEDWDRDLGLIKEYQKAIQIYDELIQEEVGRLS